MFDLSLFINTGNTNVKIGVLPCNLGASASGSTKHVNQEGKWDNVQMVKRTPTLDVG